MYDYQLYTRKGNSLVFAVRGSREYFNIYPLWTTTDFYECYISLIIIHVNFSLSLPALILKCKKTWPKIFLTTNQSIRTKKKNYLRSLRWHIHNRSTVFSLDHRGNNHLADIYNSFDIYSKGSAKKYTILNSCCLL